MEDRQEVAQELLNAFIRFGRSNWHGRSARRHAYRPDRPPVRGGPHRPERPLMREHSYRPSEIILLFCIKRNLAFGMPGMKVSEISSALRVTSPTVTQLVKGLEEHGLVERSQDLEDRRAVWIKLTKKGEKVVGKAGKDYFEDFSGLIDYLGKEESLKLVELLSKVSVYFTGEDHPLWTCTKDDVKE